MSRNSRKKMAAVVATAAKIMTIQKNSQILVNVEEALTDLIVVSYSTEEKTFQGVLLDSNKGNLPFGVYNLHPAFSKETLTAENNDDKLHSVSKRFAYQEPQYASENVQRSKKPGPKGKTQPRQKMTVRLRARKVLCSNCQGICNENSENVDVTKKRKLDSDDDISEMARSSKMEKKYLMGSTLIPKLSRLQPSEISSAIKGTNKIGKASNKSSSKDIKSESVCSDKPRQDLAFVSVSDEIDRNDNQEPKDLLTFNSTFSSARTLKICFGEGEGTVVKIPPITGDFNEDSGVSCDMNKPDSKAAKKALKKARKRQAKHTVDEEMDLGRVPKLIGALSPHNNVTNSLPEPSEKKHKHKLKHKKKHKLQNKTDENTSKCTESESINYFSDIKDQCVNQKLAINLRRSNSYERLSDLDDSGSDFESEAVPNFPVNSPKGIGGRILCVSPGDIVWGKVIGFPWWPGRVLSVRSSKAHVSWFASSTTSTIPCDSLCPFLEDYKLRFNKKKKGPYKEAVKLATVEAKRNESHDMKDPLASPTHSNLATVSPHPIDVFSSSKTSTSSSIDSRTTSLPGKLVRSFALPAERRGRRRLEETSPSSRDAANSVIEMNRASAPRSQRTSNAPHTQAADLLNSLLAHSPDTDIFADRLSTVVANAIVFLSQSDYLTL